MTNGKKIVALLSFLAAAAAGPAAAQNSGLYVGAQGGVVQYQQTCDNLVVVCDDKDGGVRVFLGYQFNKYWALEGAYADLGAAKLAGTGNSGLPVQGELAVSGFDLVAVGTIPLTDRLSFLGKLGAYRMRADFVETTSGTDTGETSAGFVYGLGLGYDMGKLGVRAEFTRYENVGGARVGEDSLFLLSLGVLFRFY
jgi:OmpA-OmpF porin, OOP family